MTAWLASLRDRPIAEHERRTAMATVAVLLAATALLLAFTQPARRAALATRGSRGAVSGAPARAMPNAAITPAPLTPVVERAAERFLAGYLSYVYGHATAGGVKDASSSLTRSLQSDPPRVPPSVRALKARVVALHPAPAPAGLTGVTAVINDGGLVDYPIGLLLAADGGRSLVTGLAGE
jgi:hypothetical protein